MQTTETSGWVQRSSEMLAGLLGGINAIVAWLIVLGAAFAGVAALSAASEAGMLALLSGVGLVAMGYVIMAQTQVQSVMLRQIVNQQKRQTGILEPQMELMRQP